MSHEEPLINILDLFVEQDLEERRKYLKLNHILARGQEESSFRDVIQSHKHLYKKNNNKTSV